MKKIELFEKHGFKDSNFSNYLVHESEYMKVINFNFKAGQTLPVHSHDLEGELTLTILEGEGEFLAADGASMPAHVGDVLISEISDPHGVKAKTDLRVLVMITPPI